MTLKITEKNKTEEIIKVDYVYDAQDPTKTRPVDKAVDPILYQLIQALDSRVAALEAELSVKAR